MLKRTFSRVLLLTLVLSLGLTASAWAGSWGCGCKGGDWGANLTPEQSAKISDLKQKFYNDTSGLRQQMLQKKAELAALWQAGTPDQGKIAAKQKELNALRDQMQQKSLEFQLQVRKIAPEAGAAYGPGMKPGRGLARGM